MVADSTDNTASIVAGKVEQFADLDLLEPGPRVGKGRDVRAGMLKASGSVIVFMDADLATPLKNLNLFYESCRRNHGIAIGTRNIRKHRKNIFRYLLSNAGNLLFRITGGLWIEDSQCGFKMFSKKAARICFGKQTIMGWSFDMEILAIARINHLPIESIRVDDWEHKPGGTFEDHLFTNGVHSLVDFLKILYKRMTGKYKFKGAK